MVLLFPSIHPYPSRGAEDISVDGSYKGKLIAGTDEYCWGRRCLCYECIHKASPGGLRSRADEGGGYITAWLILCLMYLKQEGVACRQQCRKQARSSWPTCCSGWWSLGTACATSKCGSTWSGCWALPQRLPSYHLERSSSSQEDGGHRDCIVL